MIWTTYAVDEFTSAQDNIFAEVDQDEKKSKKEQNQQVFQII